METRKTNQIYILSLEASDIVSHMNRGTSITYDYCGMIPFSLELIKLRKEGLKVKYIHRRDKEISNDIINVKFNQKLKSGNELKKIISKKLEDNNINSDYKNKLNNFIEFININENDQRWNESNVSDMRKMLYIDGFTIQNVDKGTGEITNVEYVAYKRSSAKSRTGQCLFIKKSLYNKMIKWSRMRLPFRKNMEVDLAGLLAYESLVGSTLESTIEIKPENILMISDVDSEFQQECNVVRKGESGFLDSIREITTVSNSLFDGESLLESKYFEDGVSMKLLRNHMFKSAAFNCNIQMFLQSQCPENIDYESWTLNDMFGNKVYAKDVELICTPNSLKAFKFSNVIGSDSDMWEYWKRIVSEDGNLFGVCKHDKSSKFGEDEENNILQQTSYQMINCLPLNPNDIAELTKTEKQYIANLKNNDDFFISKVKEASTLINSNEMLSALYEINHEIVSTKMYRDFRKNYIRNHVNHTMKGKIKLNGDYCVMLGNPMEFLYHAIGKFDVTSFNSPLKNNEVYTLLFDFEKEYVGFRNPNTSPSNVLVVKNKKIKDIEKYFNLTENIICVNAIEFPIQDILSGADYDSDTVLLFNNEKLLQVSKKCFGNYLVCINAIEGKKKKYHLNRNDMYEIDNQLSTSQRNIGKVVNLGQLCMSTYWDLINSHQCSSDIGDLLKKVDVMTILSGIAIDMAKKFYEIDIDKEINYVQKNEHLKKRKKKPNFWKYVSQSKTIESRVEFYYCPMDLLIEELESIERAEKRVSVPLEDFLAERSLSNVNYKQLTKIISHIKNLDDNVRSINAQNLDSDEKRTLLHDTINEHINYIGKLKINEDTTHSLIKYAVDNDSKFIMKLFNMLYLSNKELFKKSFKTGNNFQLNEA